MKNWFWMSFELGVKIVKQWVWGWCPGRLSSPRRKILHTGLLYEKSPMRVSANLKLENTRFYKTLRANNTRQDSRVSLSAWVRCAILKIQGSVKHSALTMLFSALERAPACIGALCWFWLFCFNLFHVFRGGNLGTKYV